MGHRRRKIVFKDKDVVTNSMKKDHRYYDRENHTFDGNDTS